MQLPPTILSLNNHKKKKKDSIATKASGKKTTAPKAKSGSKGKSTAPEPAAVQTPQDEDEDLEENSSDESDEGGDIPGKGDDDVPPTPDDANAKTLDSGGTNPLMAKALRRGALEPPRTLETTLFDRLEKMYGPGIKRLLNVQYRYTNHLSELSVGLTTLHSQDEPEDRRFSIEGYVS